MESLLQTLLIQQSQTIHSSKNARLEIEQLKSKLPKEIFIQLLKQYVKDYGVLYANKTQLKVNSYYPINAIKSVVLSHTGRYLAIVADIYIEVVTGASEIKNYLYLFDLETTPLNDLVPLETIKYGDYPLFTYDDRALVYHCRINDNDCYLILSTPYTDHLLQPNRVNSFHTIHTIQGKYFISYPYNLGVHIYQWTGKKFNLIYKLHYQHVGILYEFQNNNCWSLELLKYLDNPVILNKIYRLQGYPNINPNIPAVIGVPNNNIMYKNLNLLIAPNCKYLALILKQGPYITGNTYVYILDIETDKVIKLNLPNLDTTIKPKCSYKTASNFFRAKENPIYIKVKWLSNDQLLIFTRTHRLLYTAPDFVNFQSKLIKGDLAIINDGFNSQIYIGNEWNGKLVLESMDGWTRLIGRNIYFVLQSMIMKNTRSRRPVLVTDTDSALVRHDGGTNEESIDKSVVKSLFNDVNADRSAFPAIDQEYHQLKLNHIGLPRNVFSIIDINRNTAKLISKPTSKDIKFGTYHAIHVLQKEICLWDYWSGFLKYLGLPEVPDYVNDKTFEGLVSLYYYDKR